MKFSAGKRKEIIHEMKALDFDVLVIGGGITGAGIALDAISRGLTVGLIEMQDFAAGTSSRSTKLIHGGLRYLKQFEFKLVAEIGKERAIVHKNAPHLTKPELMLLPIVKNGSLGRLSAMAGMWIYEWLAGVKKSEWHKTLNAKETLLEEPLLREDLVLGGIHFYEYRTDDARLTMEVLKEAVERGTKAVNYVRAERFLYNVDNKVCGLEVKDQLDGEVHQLSGKWLVNATGPWVDELDDLDVGHLEHKLLITKGIHLVVDGGKLPVRHSVYFDTPDKRMIFIIPREGKTYIGTTDTFYSGDIAHPVILPEEKEYLIQCVNHLFPKAGIKVADVESGWAGIRPLIQKPGKGPSEISRKDEMFESHSQLLTIAGGKLTGYRKMAQKVVDRIAVLYKASGKKVPPSSTHDIALSGGKIGEAFFQTFLKEKTTEALTLGFTETEAKLLVNRYGSNISRIFEIARNLKINEPVSELSLMLRAQVHYTLEEELCTSPADFFVRRTGMLYFNIEEVKKNKDLLTDYMSSILQWEHALKVRYANELDELLKIV